MSFYCAVPDCTTPLRASPSAAEALWRAAVEEHYRNCHPDHEPIHAHDDDD